MNMDMNREKKFRNRPIRPLPRLMERTLDQLVNATECLTQFVDTRDAASAPDAPLWFQTIVTMRDQLTTLTRVRRQYVHAASTGRLVTCGACRAYHLGGHDQGRGASHSSADDREVRGE
jgi:hypothetical protein